MPALQFEIIGLVRLTLKHEVGTKTSSHVATDIRLEISENLDQDKYFTTDGDFTALGYQSLLTALTQGVVACIHSEEQSGHRKSYETVKKAIDDITKGFSTPAKSMLTDF